MGMQLSSAEYSLNTTAASMLVCSMTLPWFNQERDTDSDGYHQTDIHETSVAAADKTMGHTLEELRLWNKEKNSNSIVDDIDLLEARAFLAQCAAEGLSISVSF